MNKSLTVGDLLKWASTQRVTITLDFKNQDGRYEVDGRLFCTGVFRFIWQNGQKVGRQKAELSVLEIPLTDDSVAGIWLNVRRFGHRELTNRPTAQGLISMIHANKNRLSHDEFEKVFK